MKFDGIVHISEHGVRLTKETELQLIQVAKAANNLLEHYKFIRMKNKILDPTADEPKYLGPWKPLHSALIALEKIVVPFEDDGMEYIMEEGYFKNNQLDQVARSL